MKKFVSLALVLAMVLSLCAFTASAEDYVIRVYSNSNSAERVEWLVAAAKEAGFDKIAVFKHREPMFIRI